MLFCIDIDLTYPKNLEVRLSPLSLRLAVHLVLVFSPNIISPSLAQAEPSLNIALGAIEEGDDRYHPEWIARYDFGNAFESELHFYGRVQGHVTQSTWMLGLSRSYPIFGYKLIHARIGSALARENTVIRGSFESEATRQHTNNNLGLLLGLGIHSGGRLMYTVDWNSAIFLAGSAGLFLATARKQSLSLGVGWRI